VNQHMR